MQTRAAYKGAHLQNEAAPYVAEFIARKRLSEIGFTSRIEDLDAFKSEVFCIIDTEIDKLQSEETKKSRGK